MKEEKRVAQNNFGKAARIGLALSAEQLPQMRAHLDLLAKWGGRLNLTSVARGDMVARHLLDSLSIAKFVRGRALLDVGSGGGFRACRWPSPCRNCA